MKNDDEHYDRQLPETSPDTVPDDSYEVGYKKPPKKSRFKKGQSGNPKGRPKKKGNVKEDDELPVPRSVMRKVLSKKIKVRTSDGEAELTKLEVLLEKLLNDALNGDKHALRHLIVLQKEMGFTALKEPPKKGKGQLLVRFANAPEYDEIEEMRRRGYPVPDNLKSDDNPQKPDT